MSLLRALDTVVLQPGVFVSLTVFEVGMGESLPQHSPALVSTACRSHFANSVPVFDQLTGHSALRYVHTDILVNCVVLSISDTLLTNEP